MKIVFLSQYSGINPRGVETYVHEVSNRLVALGHDVTVFQAGPQLPQASYSVVMVPNYSFVQQVLPMINVYPDVIVPTNGRSQSYLCRLWGWSHHVKVVIPGQSGPGMDDRLNLWSLPDAFVGLTDYQCSWAKSACPFVKAVKIPNGVDLGKFNPAAVPASINLPHPIVLNVGAMEPIKRQETLIQAAEKTNASVLLVGQGSRYEYLSQLGQRRLPGRFAIMQNVPLAQMPSIYRACDLFAYPSSYWESFGIAMVEAMACGLPVLATDDPIRREIVGPAGDYVDPEDIRDFSKAITENLAKQYHDLPVRQAAQFSWDTIAAQYSQLFSSLKPI